VLLYLYRLIYPYQGRDQPVLRDDDEGGQALDGKAQGRELLTVGVNADPVTTIDDMMVADARAIVFARATAKPLFRRSEGRAGGVAEISPADRTRRVSRVQDHSRS